ncbi:MAG: hypothetical protein WD009_05230 [Phycisphaeraceae bacterium]
MRAALPTPEHRLTPPWPGRGNARGPDRTLTLDGARGIHGLAVSGDGRLAWMAVYEAGEDAERTRPEDLALWLYDLDEARRVRRIDMPEAVVAAFHERQLLDMRPLMAGDGRWLILETAPNRQWAMYRRSQLQLPTRYYVWDGRTGELVGERATADDVSGLAEVAPDAEHLQVRELHGEDEPRRWRIALWSLPGLAGEPVFVGARPVRTRWDASRLGEPAVGQSTVSADGRRLAVAMSIRGRLRRDPLLPAPEWVQTFDLASGEPVAMPVLWPGVLRPRIVALRGDRLVVSFDPPGHGRRGDHYVYRLGQHAAELEAVVDLEGPGVVTSWLSPDASALVVAAHRNQEGTPLWRLDLASGEWAEPRSWREGDDMPRYQPTVSADGRRAVVQRREQGPNDEPVLMIFDW